MCRLYKLLALYLAVIWLPASVCCALEAAGIDALCVSSSCCDQSSENGEEKAPCNAIGSSDYDSSVAAVKISPVVARICECLICLRRSYAEADTGQRASAVVTQELVRGWVPTWQFERRAAAPAHAPDWLNT